MTKLVALVIMGVELVAFWYFYNSPLGQHAVYRVWYDWIIDAAAIAAGACIMAFAARAFYRDGVSKIASLVLFLIGSWIGLLHVAKRLVRTRLI